MTSYRYPILIIFGSLLMVIISCRGKLVTQTPTITEDTRVKNELDLDRNLLQQIEKIAVKVSADSSSGSGIIIQKKQNIYSVITNRHVVNRGKSYQIQTEDRQLHTGRLVTMSAREDLAMIEFNSDRIYPVAKINFDTLNLGDSLLSAGFPYSRDRLKITSGKLLFQTEKPLKQGYQLGYSNHIQKGMSGGAIFNSLGEVVGINGRSANPIIPDYQYQDLSYPSEQLQRQMTRLSWGIPIRKAIDLMTNY